MRSAQRSVSDIAMRQLSRRDMVKASAGVAAGLAAVTVFHGPVAAAVHTARRGRAQPRLRFGVIGMNHGHIYGQVDATVRGGGELVAFHAVEPDLRAQFARRYPDAKEV